METTPKTLHISLFWNPGGIYRHQGRGARGLPLVQNAATATAAALLGQRARRFEPRAIPSVPCQVLCPVSGFAFMILTNQLL